MQPGTLARSDTQFISGNTSMRRGGSLRHIFHLFLATAFFQCWQYIIGFSVWATIICLTCQYVKDIYFPPTLLTVFGTVLGFVITCRTTSTFERYNEGRRYWSSIIYNTRTLSRTVWFNIPDVAVTVGADEDEKRARTLVEKKTVLNLTEAFAVAVKHYLRGEEGINYTDLYHLIRYRYSGLCSPKKHTEMPYDFNPGEFRQSSEDGTAFGTSTSKNPNLTSQGLPMPATSPTGANFRINKRGAKGRFHPSGEPILLPARNPPHFSVFDIFPLTLLVEPLLRHGFDIGGMLAQKIRAKMYGRGDGDGGVVVSHNTPLEITLYLSAYISALQQRKVCDAPTITLLLASLNNLVDSLTGLERILTTPIPFSYSFHLWTVTLLYCALLPFQLWGTLYWLTVPGTAISSFIFTGFIAAGEEIENPFGFGRNGLNLDHFTHNIIRAELATITSVPVPDPAAWCFRPENSSLFSSDDKERTLEPELWVRQGLRGIRSQLAKAPVDLYEEQEVSEKKKASLDSNKKIKKHKAHGEPHQQEERPVANKAFGVAATAGDASSSIGDD